MGESEQQPTANQTLINFFLYWKTKHTRQVMSSKEIEKMIIGMKKYSESTTHSLMRL